MMKCERGYGLADHARHRFVNLHIHYILRYDFEFNAIMASHDEAIVVCPALPAGDVSRRAGAGPVADNATTSALLRHRRRATFGPALRRRRRRRRRGVGARPGAAAATPRTEPPGVRHGRQRRRRGADGGGSWVHVFRT